MENPIIPVNISSSNIHLNPDREIDKKNIQPTQSKKNSMHAVAEEVNEKVVEGKLLDSSPPLDPSNKSSSGTKIDGLATAHKINAIAENVAGPITLSLISASIGEINSPEISAELVLSSDFLNEILLFTDIGITIGQLLKNDKKISELVLKHAELTKFITEHEKNIDHLSPEDKEKHLQAKQELKKIESDLESKIHAKKEEIEKIIVNGIQTLFNSGEISSLITEIVAKEGSNIATQAAAVGAICTTMLSIIGVALTSRSLHKTRKNIEGLQNEIKGLDSINTPNNQINEGISKIIDLRKKNLEQQIDENIGNIVKNSASIVGGVVGTACGISKLLLILLGTTVGVALGMSTFGLGIATIVIATITISIAVGLIVYKKRDLIQYKFEHLKLEKKVTKYDQKLLNLHTTIDLVDRHLISLWNEVEEVRNNQQLSLLEKKSQIKRLNERIKVVEKKSKKMHQMEARSSEFDIFADTAPKKLTVAESIKNKQKIGASEGKNRARKKLEIVGAQGDQRNVNPPKSKKSIEDYEKKLEKHSKALTDLESNNRYRRAVSKYSRWDKSFTMSEEGLKSEVGGIVAQIKRSGSEGFKQVQDLYKKNIFTNRKRELKQFPELSIENFDPTQLPDGRLADLVLAITSV